MVAQPEVMTLFDGSSEDPVGFALCHLETSRTVSVERSLQAVSEAAKLVVRAQARFVDAVRTARDAGLQLAPYRDRCGRPLPEFAPKAADKRLRSPSFGIRPSSHEVRRDCGISREEATTAA
jgi:hypothetical protein